MSIARKTASIAVTCVIASGILIGPKFASKSNADEKDEKKFKEYTGVAIIDEFLNDERWEEDTPWDSSQRPKLADGYATGCCAYATDYVYYCYGYSNPRAGDDFYDLNECRVGDVICTGNPDTWSIGHWAVVIQREGDVLTIAEGNATHGDGEWVVLMCRDWTIISDENRFDGDRAERQFLVGYHYLEANYWVQKDGKWYFINSTGQNTVGWKEIEEEWYYFDKDGVMQTGWQEIKGVWYYFDDEGVMQKQWQEINGSWYYFGNSGEMRKGWVKISDSWDYFGSSGSMKTGWKSDNGKWYYFGSSGVLRTGWASDDGDWYYFDDDGVMLTGWQSVDDDMYYLGTNGIMNQGWKEIDDEWFYFGGNGVMRTGWTSYHGSWYYLRSDGSMLTGWCYSGGSWYYFTTSREMVTGDYEIDGTVNHFGDDGVWEG